MMMMMKLFLKFCRIFARYGGRPRALSVGPLYRIVARFVCYGGLLEDDEARAEADRIPPDALPAILAGHRANKEDTDRLRRGFAYLVFRLHRKREEYLRKHPAPNPKRDRRRPAADLLGKWYFDLAEQIRRCADPTNKSFGFPPERIEGYIIGELLKSDVNLTEEEQGVDHLHAADYGLFQSRGESKVGQVIMDQRRKMLQPELRRIEPFAKTRFEKSVIGLALSDYDVEEIREVLHGGVTDRQITDALESIRERADKK